MSVRHVGFCWYPPPTRKPALLAAIPLPACGNRFCFRRHRVSPVSHRRGVAGSRSAINNCWLRVNAYPFKLSTVANCGEALLALAKGHEGGRAGWKGTAMKAEQIRAARAALRWSRADLAMRAGIHAKSVAYWENRDGSQSTVGAIPKIRAAFIAAGIEIEGGRVCI